MARLLALTFVLLLLPSPALTQEAQDDPVPAQLGERDHARAQAAVRKYLKENLDNPWFEEVQWWPARKRWTDEEYRTLVRKARQSGGRVDANCTIIRLKFRTKNRLDALMIADHVFTVKRGGDVGTGSKWLQVHKNGLWNEPLSDAEKTQRGWGGFLDDLADGKYSGKERDRKTPR